jgi:peroxiredoxin
MKRLTIIFTLILIIGGVLLSADAPSFELKDIYNRKVDSDDIYGNGVVVVEFWSTTCSACKDELPHLNDLYLEYREDGLIAIAISVDSARLEKDVKPFIQGRGYKFKVLLDPDKDAYRAFHVASIPMTFIIDEEGKLVYTHLGYNPGDEDVLEEEIKKALGL